MTSKQLSTIIEEVNLISKLWRIPRWNDDPNFFRFATSLRQEAYSGDGNFPDTGSGGTSLDATIAQQKAIFEGFERFSQSYFKFNDFIYSNYRDLPTGQNKLDPKIFCYFSQAQLKSDHFNNFSYDSTTPFNWTTCTKLETNEVYFIPAQLVYCPYKYTNEMNIMLPTSTGTALGLSRDEAIYKGICETIERDAFIIDYLLSRPPKKVELTSLTSKLGSYISKLLKYRINFQLYQLNSELNIPTMTCVLQDNSPTTPAISIGLKTDIDLENAIVGAIDEAFQIRSWSRYCIINKKFRGNTYLDKVMLRRMLFWSNPSNLPFYDFVLSTKKRLRVSKSDLTAHQKKTYTQKLAVIFKEIQQHKLDVYIKDITHPLLRDHNMHVYKTVIPSLQPLFIDEDYPYLGGSRLEKIRKRTRHSLNLVPHPFL